MNKKYTLHVSGTHCASCKILIDDVLSEQSFIKNSKVDLKNETVEIETDSDQNLEEIASLLTNKIKPNGYTLSVEKQIKAGENHEVLWQAVPLGLVLLVLFFVLQKSGLLNFGIGGETTPLVSFVVGLVASVSSCLAIVGGLVLSLSAKIFEDKVSDTKTFLLFHSGRLASFAVLGGVLGLIGGAVGINFTFSAVLGLLSSLVMVFLGLNLIGVLVKNEMTLSSGFFNFFRKIEHKVFTPLLVGFGTFFLPCGFTQAMQAAAIGSGSFLSGMLIMFSFALGTLPMLLFLSFGSASFARSAYAPLFFKTVGVVVLGLGVFGFLAGLAGLGIISPLFSI